MEVGGTDRCREPYLCLEVQAVDPDAVAARWSEIVEVDQQRDDSGQPRIKLDNATIRLLPADDDRGDGLAGIELVAVDPDSAGAAARRRGLLDDAGRITICGTRFSFGNAP